MHWSVLCRTDLLSAVKLVQVQSVLYKMDLVSFQSFRKSQMNCLQARWTAAHIAQFSQSFTWNLFGHMIFCRVGICDFSKGLI